MGVDTLAIKFPIFILFSQFLTCNASVLVAVPVTVISKVVLEKSLFLYDAVQKSNGNFLDCVALDTIFTMSASAKVRPLYAGGSPSFHI